MIAFEYAVAVFRPRFRLIPRLRGPVCGVCEVIWRFCVKFAKRRDTAVCTAGDEQCRGKIELESGGGNGRSSVDRRCAPWTPSVASYREAVAQAQLEHAELTNSMDDSAEVSTLSYIDVLLKSLDKSLEADSGDAGTGRDDGGDAVPDSTTSLPEKTLVAHSFHCGDDVLVPKQDGKYYLGSIIELSAGSLLEGEARCLIKFGDGTRWWAPTSSVKLLSAPPPDDGSIMCVVCKRREGASGCPGEAVIACDMCGRGYHGKCHTPTVDTWINGASWNCRRCVDQRYRVAAAENRAQKRAVVRLKGDVRRRAFMQQPCDTASTTSSTASEHGKDDSHCYCGEKTDNLAQMLMCCRCSRWFHQRCVCSLQYPLYAGDKLYIFGCATCNGGAEYLRRLELRWLDLAHLALYNLTAFNSRNYFDLDAVIMPYIMDNWHALQLPQKMWCTSVGERRERILTALTASRARFKSGREMKKRATIWGLRVRRPPPFPLHLGALAQAKENEPLTDDLVSRLAPRLRFLPRTRSISPPADNRDSTQPTSSNNGNSSYTAHNQNMIVPVDGHWLNLMMGKRFRQNLNSNDTENDSPCSSPSPTEFMNNTLSSHSASFSLRCDMLKMNDVSADSPYTFDEDTDHSDQRSKYKKPLKLYKMDYHNGGFVKKSVPFSKQPTGPKRKFTNSDEKKRKISKHKLKTDEEKTQNSSTKEHKINRESSPLHSSIAFPRSSPRVKDRSPSADPEIILKGDCSTSSFDSAKPMKLEPPLPAATVSCPASPGTAHMDDSTTPDPPKRKLSTLSDSLLPCSVHIDKLTNNEMSDKNSDSVSGFFAGAHTSKIAIMNLELSKLSTKNIIEHSKIMSLQQWGPEGRSRGVSYERESSSDETSSRGTLDAIIPPLKNFQGKNNPFLMLNSGSDKKTPFSMASKLFNKQSVTKNGLQHPKSRISLPIQLTPVLPPVRHLKRQLSEKDLVIGPNGEVKRRKHRRPRKNGQLNQSCPLPDRGKTSQTDEVQKKDSNGRRLRQRQERNYFENGRRPSGVGAAAATTPTVTPSSEPVRALQLSPQKAEPPQPQQLMDLKSSVRSYFGALTRMRAGEGFTVAARRTSQAGRAQYLIEWASPHAS